MCCTLTIYRSTVNSKCSGKCLAPALLKELVSSQNTDLPLATLLIKGSIIVASLGILRFFKISDKIEHLLTEAYICKYNTGEDKLIQINIS